MDNFINLAKKGYQAYEDANNNNNSGSNQYQNSASQERSHAQSQQDDYRQTSSNQSYGSENYGSSHGGVEADVDEDQVIKSARKQSDRDDDDDGEDSMFGNALAFAKSRFGTAEKASEPIDETRAQEAHAQAYRQGQGANMDTNSLGMAAAMQAMKAFTGGSQSGSSSQNAQGSSQMIGMAISEASKLFSKTGGAADGGSKQDVMNVAAGMVMKLVLQSKMSGLMGSSATAASGGGSSASSLFSLASQFLKVPQEMSGKTRREKSKESNSYLHEEKEVINTKGARTEYQWAMKFGTALLFNSRSDWLPNYIDYEALKKAIPEPPIVTQPAPFTNNDDLESAPLLDSETIVSSRDDQIEPLHKPFFKLLNKELTKVAKFYQETEKRLAEEVEELKESILDEEKRDLDGRDDWERRDHLSEEEGNDGYDDEAGETVGSLNKFLHGGVHTGKPARSRSRSRGASELSRSPSHDTSDLFEAQHSSFANRLRYNAHGHTSTDQEDDSSPENSPVIPASSLPNATLAKHPSNNLSPTANIKRRGRKNSTVSSSGGAVSHTRPGQLGLVPVDANTFASGSSSNHGLMLNSVTSEAFVPNLDSRASAGAHMEGTVNVWTSNSQQASMLKILFKRKITTLWLDWVALRNFRELNQEGAKKALKKFDKITSSSTKDFYLTSILQTHYPWHGDVQAKLEYFDHLLISTYARVVVGGDKALAGRQLGSQLREKVIIERDTVWRQMVSSQRSGDLAGGYIRAVPDPRAASGHLAEKGLGGVTWLSQGGVIFAGAFLILILLATGTISTFERVEEQNCLAILVFCTILWASEAIPLFVTSISVPFFVVVLRVLRSTDGQDTRMSAPDATKYIFSQMFSPTIMLLIGGFTIAAALSKTHMDVIMAKKVMTLAGQKPSMVLLSQMFLATFASMWISNVAAPTLCFALIKPITEKLPPNSPFTRCLILAIALASNIGGQASPISSPQNLIALQAMEPALDWLQWFAISLPVASVSLIIIWAFLHLGYRWESDLLIQPVRPHGDTFNRTHYFVLFVTLITIGLWYLVKGGFPSDVNSKSFLVVFLAMGGIALGKAVLSSGLLDVLDSVLERLVEGMGLWQILCVFATVAMVVSTFISHTIASILLVPIASRVGESLETPHPRLLIMATALICSAGMGLPVSGFPNLSAISQEDSLGRRYLNAGDFLKNGIPATVLATGVVVTVGYVIMKVIGL
ncbi:Na /dicarboxylate, Na /tricarboxylate and phosphate transporters [Phaffia rhodozyma]|uniref:Na /dicarboxylate, Na /tricarboxylate and phosphate transporters n=1 Tax=Phaffia rhodozyma TaxID=264483 RepID=A0A0F7SPD6_PHARH|nr:Na /dicarboxylate, Na /tricarboxylate and phosphate transporters [Phaffia rhodozyma]